MLDGFSQLMSVLWMLGTNLVCIANRSIQPVDICDQENSKEEKDTVNHSKMRADYLDAPHTRTTLAEQVGVFLHGCGFIAGVLLGEIDRDFSSQRHGESIVTHRRQLREKTGVLIRREPNRRQRNQGKEKGSRKNSKIISSNLI